MTGQLIYSDRELVAGDGIGEFDPPSVKGFKRQDGVFGAKGHHLLLYGNDGRLLFADGLAIAAYVNSHPSDSEVGGHNICPMFEVSISGGDELVCEEHIIGSHPLRSKIYGSGKHTVSMKLSDSGKLCNWRGDYGCEYILRVGAKGHFNEPSNDYTTNSKYGTFGSGAVFSVDIDSETGYYVVS